MYSIIRQTSVPSVVYIPAVGHVTDTHITSTDAHITNSVLKKYFHIKLTIVYSKHETINNYKEQFSFCYSKVID